MSDSSSIRKRDRENAQRERHQRRDDPDTVEVYLGNATVTSGGTGPGVVRVPRDEAARLIRDRLAIAGPNEPQNWASHAVQMAGRMRPR